MDNAKQHWKILQELARTDLASRVRSFMVVGRSGDGVLVTTDDGEGFWLGTVQFELGISSTAIEPTSLNVPNGLVQMAQGHGNILLLNKNGQIYEIKRNYANDVLLRRLINFDQKSDFLPNLISSTNNFTSVRCGQEHSMALTEDGKVWAWGENKFGQVGVSSFSPIISPCQIPELDPYRVVAVECGGRHSLALTDRGDVYAWGGNNQGQVGNKSESSTQTSTQILNFTRLLNTTPIRIKTPTQISTPTRIPTPSPVKSMAAGSHHTLLLTRTGEVWACGSNKRGQLGLPTSTTEFSHSLVKVEGLPSISQIASHFFTSLSIAMSFDQRCFVWGQLHDQTSIPTPRELSSFYSTVESPLSFYSTDRSTPHSVPVPETRPNRLTIRMSRMLDDQETSDVQFVVEQRTIHAHRIILSKSSDYFARMFSERWMTTVNLNDPIVKVTIPDNSYEVFYTFLRFLYTDSFEVHSDHLPELFELASLYLESDLQQLCIRRMRTTLNTATCCHYYPLTHRHSLPELNAFQQELVQFASTRMSEITDSVTFQSMESDLRDNLSNAVENFLGN